MSEQRAGGSNPAGGQSGTQTEVREHLANERTLLAWVRTGVSLISFGLVIERLGTEVSSSATSGMFGVALAVLGCLALIMGTAQFLRSRRGIESGEFVSAALAYMVVVAGSLALAGTFIVYVLLFGG
jgi:putative membrane protein